MNWHKVHSHKPFWCGKQNNISMLLQVQTSNLITEMTFNYNGTFGNNPWKSSWFLAISILKGITHKMRLKTCWSKRNVKFDIIEVSYAMRLLFLMFVTAVCVLFLLTPGSFNNIHVIQNRKRFPTFNLLCSRKMCSHTRRDTLSRNVAWRLT